MNVQNQYQYTTAQQKTNMMGRNIQFQPKYCQRTKDPTKYRSAVITNQKLSVHETATAKPLQLLLGNRLRLRATLPSSSRPSRLGQRPLEGRHKRHSKLCSPHFNSTQGRGPAIRPTGEAADDLLEVAQNLVAWEELEGELGAAYRLRTSEVGEVGRVILKRSSKGVHGSWRRVAW